MTDAEVVIEDRSRMDDDDVAWRVVEIVTV